ncbi:hypothetical protein [Chroococcidiopsis sp. SAG 2025]|uniref:hypothetical protein n=1 Tax=Chroococcidiopsis sp. SAG 2025 TaxID=171389 RepID=UPI002936E1C2|nr:hypothetical protein [Chroococcidiopsis sp. SAG 2025]
MPRGYRSINIQAMILCLEIHFTCCHPPYERSIKNLLSVSIQLKLTAGYFYSTSYELEKVLVKKLSKDC